MNGSTEPDGMGVPGGSGSERAADPHRAAGAEGAELGSDYPPTGFEGEDVVDAEVEGGVTTEIIDGTAPELGDDESLAAVTSQRDEYLDSLRRLQAEFENYKKRVAKQQTDQVARAAVSLVDKVLPVLDTLDLAVQHLGDAESSEGRALVAVSSQLHDVLTKEGLERIDPVGEPFDPNAHEAVGHVPAEEEPQADAARLDPTSGEPVVAQVMRAGYRWRGTVVRPAMVMVRG
ncbi:MAG: nucleotide exchange factor GrpE [Acidimicrobiales bacterium]